MKFTELTNAELPAYLKQDVEALLYLKMNVPEKKMIPRNDRLNSYLDRSISELEIKCAERPRTVARDRQELEQIFLREVGYIPE